MLFGSTGDLARSKILPALEKLISTEALPIGSKLWLVGRRSLTTSQYFKTISEDAYSPFQGNLDGLNPEYLRVDFDASEGFASIGKTLASTRAAKNLIIYLALGPDAIKLTLKQLLPYKQELLAVNLKFIIEKPYGDSLQDAEQIDDLMLKLTSPENIFRNDHYLNKGVVENLAALHATGEYTPEVLNENSINEIKLVVSETLDIGDRAGYFDCRGMSVDWFQSHMLQLLALICADAGVGALHKAKADFISSLSIEPESILRGQYDGYHDANGTEPSCETETFIGVKMKSSQTRWRGVTFSMVAGKALADKAVFIDLYQPESKDAKARISIEPAGLNNLIDSSIGSEYFKTIAQAIDGDQEFFVSRSEMLAQWKLTEELLTEIKNKPMFSYPKGSPWENFCGESWC